VGFINMGCLRAPEWQVIRVRSSGRDGGDTEGQLTSQRVSAFHITDFKT